ncbi:hypothetical protein HDV05_000662, partial [Chytridiales sp. JEL 0842]
MDTVPNDASNNLLNSSTTGPSQAILAVGATHTFTSPAASQDNNHASPPDNGREERRKKNSDQKRSRGTKRWRALKKVFRDLDQDENIIRAAPKALICVPLTDIQHIKTHHTFPVGRKILVLSLRSGGKIQIAGLKDTEGAEAVIVGVWVNELARRHPEAIRRPRTAQDEIDAEYKVQDEQDGGTIQPIQHANDQILPSPPRSSSPQPSSSSSVSSLSHHFVASGETDLHPWTLLSQTRLKTPLKNQRRAYLTSKPIYLPAETPNLISTSWAPKSLPGSLEPASTGLWGSTETSESTEGTARVLEFDLYQATTGPSAVVEVEPVGTTEPGDAEEGQAEKGAGKFGWIKWKRAKEGHEKTRKEGARMVVEESVERDDSSEGAHGFLRIVFETPGDGDNGETMVTVYRRPKEHVGIVGVLKGTRRALRRLEALQLDCIQTWLQSFDTSSTAMAFSNATTTSNAPAHLPEERVPVPPPTDAHLSQPSSSETLHPSISQEEQYSKYDDFSDRSSVASVSVFTDLSASDSEYSLNARQEQRTPRHANANHHEIPALGDSPDLTPTNTPLNTPSMTTNNLKDNAAPMTIQTKAVFLDPSLVGVDGLSGRQLDDSTGSKNKLERVPSSSLGLQDGDVLIPVSVSAMHIDESNAKSMKSLTDSTGGDSTAATAISSTAGDTEDRPMATPNVKVVRFSTPAATPRLFIPRGGLSGRSYRQHHHRHSSNSPQSRQSPNPAHRVAPPEEVKEEMPTITVPSSPSMPFASFEFSFP